MPIYTNGISSIYRTDTGIVTTAGKPGLLYGYTLIGGTTASSAIFADGTGSGTTKWKATIKAQTVAGDDSVSYTFSEPIVFSTDIYVTLAGTSAAISVAYYQLNS